MPSRELRRAVRRKSEKQETAVEKKRERHPVIYAFTVVILVIVVVTFVGGYGASRAARGSGARIVFGSYEGTPVEYAPDNYLAQQVERINDQLRATGAIDGSNPEAETYQVWRLAFDQSVLHTAVLLETRRAGMWISSDRLEGAFVKSGPYSVAGNLDEERWARLSRPEQEAALKLFREQMLHDQYLFDVLYSPRISERETEFFAAMVEEQRRFDFVSFPFSAYPEELIAAYAEQNRDRFRRIKLSSILVKSSERDAQEVRRKLEERAGSFEELARAHSKDLYAEKGGEMGWRYFYDLEADFDKPETVEGLFALQEGEISAVLQNKYGWAIYRCDSPALPIDPQDPEALQEVRDYVMRYERGLVEDHAVGRAEAFRSRVGDVGFLGASLEAGTSVGSTEFFPINFQGYYELAPVRSAREGFQLNDAASSEEFFLKAFALPLGGVSTPILLGDQVVVLELAEVRQAPQAERDLVGRYLEYFAQQALERDLQSTLLDPDRLEDNFTEAFYKHIYVRQ